MKEQAHKKLSMALASWSPQEVCLLPQRKPFSRLTVSAASAPSRRALMALRLPLQPPSNEREWIFPSFNSKRILVEHVPLVLYSCIHSSITNIRVSLKVV